MEKKITFNAKNNIEIVCSGDSLRENMVNPYAVAGDGIIATDGKILLRVNDVVNDEYSGFLPKNVIRSVRRRGANSVGLCSVSVEDDKCRALISDGSIISNSVNNGDGSKAFPDYKKILKRKERIKNNNKVVFAIDVDLLSRLCRGLGTSQVKITLNSKKTEEPIFVEALDINSRNAEGAIMPMVIFEQNRV